MPTTMPAPFSWRIFLSFPSSSSSFLSSSSSRQAVEPVDPRTRESLQRSVQLAIEITTRSQEARAKHEALRDKERAKGKLEQQQLRNKTAAEETRRGLLELEAASKVVEAEGAAVAQARAQSESKLIEAQAMIASARVRGGGGGGWGWGWGGIGWVLW
jgi:major vault protein